MSIHCCRHLILVLGDQLDPDAPDLVGLDRVQDRVWMCEARAEATHPPSHKARIALFLSAMRHFRDRLLAEGIPAGYRGLNTESDPSLGAGLAADLRTLRPQRVVLTQPGEHRVLAELRQVCDAAGVPLDVREDAHFICSTRDFAAWAGRRSTLVLEHFYRHLRRRESVLMDGDRPQGGRWNLDQENRKPFGRRGPGLVPVPLGFPPDETTREVMNLVEEQFPEAPGRLDRFDWPVTAEQSQKALADFIDHRLAQFGPHQDAMWTGQPYLYHARISAALNLKLLDPRVPIAAAVEALESNRAPLNSVEGFVRQILGWREYIRGVYWREGPEYLARNSLDVHQPLPAFYWTGETDYACLRTVIGQVLDTGYAHHIQRLMVTGLFALLLGVEPRQVHAWYLALFVDAVEWVEAPNTLGMSQYADGGLLASKPYAASGAYIRRMSNYCAGCRFDPGEALGEGACPFTTLYWDFLARHQGRFAAHPRTALQWRNLERLEPRRVAAIRRAADGLRHALS